jgi:hypothetical protein
MSFEEVVDIYGRHTHGSDWPRVKVEVAESQPAPPIDQTHWPLPAPPSETVIYGTATEVEPELRALQPAERAQTRSEAMAEAIALSKRKGKRGGSLSDRVKVFFK